MRSLFSRRESKEERDISDIEIQEKILELSEVKESFEENIEKENKIFQMVIDHFIVKEGNLMSSLEDESLNKEFVRNEIERKAKEQFRNRCNNTLMETKLMERFNHYMWGYYVLEPLLKDPEIFDITTYSYDRVRAERLGVWEDGRVQFADKNDYEQFIRMVCTRNKMNLSLINAQVKFTDAVNNPDFILRFNISSGILNSSGDHELHIRKIPKNKFSMEELVKMGYMTEIQKEYIKNKVKSGHNIFFAGSNGSGKTFGLNAVLDEIPEGQSGLIVQESDELFTSNPDFLCQHVKNNNGEGKIKYGLKELANVGLMDGRDIFVLGEVKSGEDAASLPMMTATGSQILFTGHGNNEVDAIYKIADYIKQETGYDLDQCLRFLTNILVIYCKKFKVIGMSLIKEWNHKNNQLVIEKLDENCRSIKEESDKEYIDLNSYILS